jgi:hypothetical protein
MFAVPAVTPVTTPFAEPTVAIAMSLLLHVPDAVASVNVMVEPWHTVVAPVIAAGTGLTVTGNVDVTKGDAHVPGSVQVTTQK